MKIKTAILSAVLLTVGLLAAGCNAKAQTGSTEKRVTEAAAEMTEGTVEADMDKEASSEGTVTQSEAVGEVMVPVYAEKLKDGLFPINVDSSSSMFQITECGLKVKDGTMSAVMTMGGTGYLKLYMGTGEEALKANESDYIPYTETPEGAHTYEIPVEALDMGINCSAFSKKKKKWYDRVLVFRSDSLPAEAFAEGAFTTPECLNLEDGSYTAEVSLEGGSGRASVESPAVLRVEGGMVFATVIWGSSNYDYMKVNDEKYERLSAEGNSAFEIPVRGFDRGMAVIADTIAMSEPHEISYTLTFDSSTLKRAE